MPKPLRTCIPLRLPLFISVLSLSLLCASLSYDRYAAEIRFRGADCGEIQICCIGRSRGINLRCVCGVGTTMQNDLFLSGCLRFGICSTTDRTLDEKCLGLS